MRNGDSSRLETQARDESHKSCQEVQSVDDGLFMVDFSIRGGGLKYCGLSRRYDMSKCDYLGDIDVLISFGDGQGGLYKNCTKKVV